MFGDEHAPRLPVTATSALTARLAIQLSMIRGESISPSEGYLIRHLRMNFVELIGIEPTTSGLQSQRSPN